MTMLRNTLFALFTAARSAARLSFAGFVPRAVLFPSAPQLQPVRVRRPIPVVFSARSKVPDVRR